MNILISNDDGIRAEGIARLAAAALPFGRVYVAAPQSQCSGMSQKLTIRANWDIEQTWRLGDTPRFRQKPQELVKQKADAKKTPKNRNAERERQKRG